MPSLFHSDADYSDQGKQQGNESKNIRLTIVYVTS
jgi:hypothetical protein